MEWLSILPNLSIGALSVLSLVYVTIKFLDGLEKQENKYTAELKEREIAMRALEKEVRTHIMDQLTENTRAMERVITYINK